MGVSVPGYSEVQLVHRGTRHLVYRASLADGRRVALKVVAPEASAREVVALRHEFELLSELHLDGVVEAHTLSRLSDGLALELGDAGKESLRERLGRGPLSLSEFFPAALQLAQALGRVHRRGIVHRDVNPTNAVWEPATGMVTLIDFGLATTIAATPALGGAPARLEGTLPYLAPEQTGRTEHSVDARSDLYALGCTFYELLCGRPPFVSTDPIELVHAHLAVEPAPLRARRPEVPEGLALIIQKLLAKPPEDRYQTDRALLDDLAEARALWATSGDVPRFRLARRDVPERLVVPEKLYGREHEGEVLLQAFGEACQGRTGLVLVTGDAGIGKSALVRQLVRPALKRRGLFLEGKFDTLKRAVPYAAVAEALKGVVQAMLAEPEASLSAWRERLVTALGANAKAMIDLVSELELVLGAQPPLPEVGPAEARERLALTVGAFVAATALPECPVVLFLDDLQWIDAGSLFLLTALVGPLEGRCLLVVGAYREREVAPEHPLARAIDELGRSGRAPKMLRLGPLAPSAVRRLVADALWLPPERVRPLSSLVAQRTDGNPFFVRKLLQSLEERRLLRFDPSEGQWTWDAAKLDQVEVTDNVGELLGQALERLPAQTQKLVSTAACVGHRFELQLLARVEERTVVDTAAVLWPAVTEGLLVPLEDAARMPLRYSPDLSFVGVVLKFEFAHDRVQQTAYERLTPAARQAVHLRVGRCLLESAANGGLFDAVDHLDRAAELVHDAAERAQLAELNLRTGLEAMKASAHGVALGYLTAGMELLPASPWVALPELAGALYRERARCAYINGDHPLAERLIAAALPHARNPAEGVALLRIRIDSATLSGDFARAIAAGRVALGSLGVEMPSEGVPAAAVAEVGEAMRALEGVLIAGLAEAPAMQGAEALLRVQLLASLATPAYLHDPDLFAFLQARMVRLCLAEGMALETSQAFATYAIVHGAASGDWAVAHELGRLGVTLARRFGNPAYLCRVLHVFANHVNHWRAPLATDAPLFREAIQWGLEAGEIQFVGHAATGLVNHLFPAGEELPALAEELKRSAAFVARHRNRSMSEIQTAFRQAIRCLQGKTRAPASFDDEEFDEARYLDEAGANQTALCCYEVLRLQVAYLFGDLASARRLAQQAQARLPSVLGLFTFAEHAFYAALTAAACAAEGTADERIALRQEAETYRRQLDGWAAHCTENFRHKERLVAAELFRLDGQPWEALGLYDEAIDGARNSGFLQDEALANERAASLLALAGRHRAARPYFHAAREGYQRWGAAAKVASLDRQGPAIAGSAEWTSSVISSSEPTLDALSLMKAARAISSEVVLEPLLGSLMPILLEAAGAERGALLLEEGGGLVVRARASALSAEVTREATPLGVAADLPRAVVDYVRRTRQPLVLTDARHQGPFTSEPDVRRRGVHSVLCSPVRTPARELGVLYLENNGLPGAFGRDRVEVVALLAAQVATSLENARLFERIGQESEAHARARAAAEQALEVRDEFLQIAAHELRTPLATLKLRIEALRRGGVPSQERVAREVDPLMRQVDRLAVLVSSLLDVARLTSGRLKLNCEEVDLAALVRQVAGQMSMDAQRAGCELRVEVGAPTLVGRWDALRVEQVVQNLLSNALKFGSGHPVDIEVRGEGERALVSVRDHGPGIAAADVERIFGRFERAVSARHYGGLGLGLYIARQLAEAHGGRIRVETRAGEGSTFILELPR